MSPINCPNCGKEVPDAAETCPHCDFDLNTRAETPAERAEAAPKKKMSKKTIWFIIGGVVLVVLIAICLIVALVAGLLAYNKTSTSSTQKNLLFNEGLARFSYDGESYGYLDKKGEIVINPQFDSVSIFTDGYAIVSSGDKYGVIDKDAKYVINPSYDGLGLGSEKGNIFTFEEDSEWGYMDLKEEVIVRAKFDYAIPFFKDHKLALVQVDGAIGAIDKKGEYIFRPDYGLSQFFTESGYAGAYEYDNDDYEWGVINTKGEFVIEPQYEGYLFVCENDLVLIEDRDEYGFVNLDNEEVIEPQFSDANCFIDGYAAVAEDDEWGVIDEKGEYVIEPKYDRIYSYHEGGIFLYMQNDEYGFVSVKDGVILKANYEDANVFSNGLAAVMDGEEWGYINTKGEWVIKPQFDTATSFFDDGYAVISDRGDYGVIDMKGNFIIEPDFDSIF